jgi:hypothetical protein
MIHQFAFQFTLKGHPRRRGDAAVPASRLLGRRREPGRSPTPSERPEVREAELWRSLEETGQFTSLSVEMIKVGGRRVPRGDADERGLLRRVDRASPSARHSHRASRLIVMGGVIATPSFDLPPDVLHPLQHPGLMMSRSAAAFRSRTRAA